ncbi:unnamed protein product [Dimorphilus gyrociliatus]|nr:unnamed protein product [Dimorphilus gyrociliatus]
MGKENPDYSGIRQEFWSACWNVSRLSLLSYPKLFSNLMYPTALKTIKESSTMQNSTKYPCDGCGKLYVTFNGLSRHKQFHCHAYFGKPEFVCKQCKKTYSSAGALKMHIRTHTLPCKCPFCEKAFSRPWLLQGHIRTHTGEKPFSCNECGRAFADRSNLRAHVKTHSVAKEYACSCLKTFSRMSLLTKHKRGNSCQ